MQTFLQNTMHDIRYALRQLRRSPGFTLTAVVILALGIGANAAIFTLVHAVLLRNLPVVEPKALVRLGGGQECCVQTGLPENDAYSMFSYEAYRYLQANAPEFEQMAAVQSYPWTMTVRDSKEGTVARGVPASFVSGNYFQMFGLQPFAGRLLTPTDDQPGAPPVAVISYQTWQRDYGSDRSVLGRVFSFKMHPVIIVGIAPAGFYGDRMIDSPANFFLPFALEPLISQSSLLRSKSNWIYILGRLRPGTQLALVQDKLSGDLRQWLHANLDLYKQQSVAKHLAATHMVLTPGGAGITNMQAHYKSGLQLLLTISALVLLIACANLANLLLVRSMGRAAETSLRLALGAQRTRILSQILTESLVLSITGGVAGLLIAYGGTRVLLALAFPNAPNLPIQATPSIAVLGFAFGVSLLTGLVFGLAPAWITARSQPADALRGINRAAKGGSSLLQRLLVILQTAFSVVLLIGAGLLSRSLGNLEHQEFGLETTDRIVIHIDPQSAGYKPAQLQALFSEIETNFHAIPGVEQVGLAGYSPLEGDSWGEGVMINGHAEPSPDTDIGARWLRVNPELLNVIGQKVLRGRGITPQDTSSAPGVAVVNQAFVKKFLRQGEEPVGARFGTNGFASTNDFTIVGVIRDAKWSDPSEPVHAMYFRPLLQIAASAPKGEDFSLHTGTIMLKTRGPVAGLELKARQTLSEINPNLPVTYYKSFEDQIADQFTQERLIARLTMLFSGLALVLASVGLYGITSYSVARRTPEIGIRMALGANRGSVVAMVLRAAMLQAGLGLLLGIPAALLCVRFVQTQLYDVTGQDRAVLVSAVLALTLAAFIACLIPARRAASIDPIRALRAE